MNDTKMDLLLFVGSVIVSVSLVSIFHIGTVKSIFGTIAAGVTNYSGISITGTPGTFDVSATTTETYSTDIRNGVTKLTYRSTMGAATTTVCSFQSPAATSTLEYASAYLTISSTTASVLTIAKGTGSNSSTTLIVAAPISANAQGTLIASSTPTGASLDGTNVIAPNNYVNVSMSGGTGTFSPTGVCQATFRQVN